MISLSQRAYSPKDDQRRVEELHLATRTGKALQRYPTIWRVRQLLATRLWEPERDARVWEDEQGCCLGFAFLTRRQREGTPGADTLLHPQVVFLPLFTEMVDWIDTRVQQLADERNEKVNFSMATYEGETQEITVLEQKGYVLSALGDDLYMARSLAEPIAVPPLPPGFTVRPLVGEHEVDAYMGLFRFAAMTREHRLELLAHPDEYAHLVVVAPDDRFVGYCECSINRCEWAQSGERIGWVDYIATIEEFRRLGLAKAVMAAALQQLQAWGAETVVLVTTSSNTNAISFYEGLGFQAVHNVYYDKTFESSK